MYRRCRDEETGRTWREPLSDAEEELMREFEDGMHRMLRVSLFFIMLGALTIFACEMFKH